MAELLSKAAQALNISDDKGKHLPVCDS
jgi:hypothetical protein